MVIKKVEMVVLKDEVEEGFYDVVFWCDGWEYVSMLIDEVKNGVNAFFMWDIGV